jgi:hypothetical protein
LHRIFWYSIGISKLQKLTFIVVISLKLILMQNTLKIVGIQTDLVWENSQQNISFFEEKINDLERAVDLIVLPEMFTTGFTIHPERVAVKMDGFSVLWMQKIAKNKQVAICGSLVISDNGTYYNRLIFVIATLKFLALYFLYSAYPLTIYSLALPPINTQTISSIGMSRSTTLPSFAKRCK